MKKMLAALLFAGLTGSAFAAAAPPATNNPDNDNHHRAAAVPLPGAHQATIQSLGEMKPYAAIIGIAAVGVIVAASSNSHHTSGTTGTTP